MTKILSAALLVLLGVAAGCASPGGLYTMSDAWCAKHPEASPARCARNPLREYDVQGHQPEDCGDRIPMYADEIQIGCFPIRRGS